MLKLKPDELTKPFRSTLLKILAHKFDETDAWLDAQLGAAGTDGFDIAWWRLVSCSGGSEKEALLLLKKSRINFSLRVGGKLAYLTGTLPPLPQALTGGLLRGPDGEFDPERTDNKLIATLGAYSPRVSGCQLHSTGHIKAKSFGILQRAGTAWLKAAGLGGLLTGDMLNEQGATPSFHAPARARCNAPLASAPSLPLVPALSL